MPPGVVTVMSTAPAARAGALAVIWVDELTTRVAGVVPKLTPVAPLSEVPVMTTLVPPAVGPCAGAMPVTTGALK